MKMNKLYLLILMWNFRFDFIKLENNRNYKKII